MDRNRRDVHEEGTENSVEGSAKDIKGRLKDAAGGLSGDHEMQAEGKWDRIKGKVQKEVGEAQRRSSRRRDDHI